MLPEAHISHRTMHRLRIKIPSKKGNQVFFRKMEESFLDLPGVESIETNPLTSSVLICHHADPRSLCELIRQRSIVNLKEPSAPTTVRQDIFRGFKTANTQISSLTGGKADLWDVAGLSLIGSGIYQMLKGNFAAPAWYTAFWYAFGILGRAPSSSETTGK